VLFRSNMFTAWGRSVSLIEYRTLINGSVFHRGLGTTTESDLASSEILYTGGGTLENIPPPPVGSFVQTRNRLLVASAERPDQLWASKDRVAGDGISFNDALVMTQQSKVVALGALNDSTIVFLRSSICRIDGDWPDNAGSGAFPFVRELFPGIGCINKQSVVHTPQGIIFKSDDGWYLIDQGFALQPIGKSVQDYDALVVARCLSLPDRGEAWLLHTDGTVLVWDWIRQQWSTHDFGSTISGVLKDAVICNNLAHLLDEAGSVFRETDDYVDVAAEISTQLTTGWYSFAGVQGFQRVYSATILGEWKSAHSLEIGTYFDYNETVIDSKSMAVASDPGTYQIKIKPSRQKCQSIKLAISDTGLSGTGEGFVLSGIAFEVGIIGGPARIAATKVV
jgi:hypothetical protein